MNEIGLIKKLKLFWSYRGIVLRHRKELDKTFNIRVDDVYRLYTVLNVDPKKLPDPYNVVTNDIEAMQGSAVKGFLSGLGIYLNNKGLNELYEIYECEKIDENHYLVVVGFSLFNSGDIAKTIITRWIPALSLLALLTTLFLIL
jgi:hypothetical protein